MTLCSSLPGSLFRHKIESSGDGKEAFEIFKADPAKYDLIITNLSMPRMSGRDLTKEVRKLNSEVPILLSSGKLGVKDTQELKDIGITSFIQKPWKVKELLDQIYELEI